MPEFVDGMDEDKDDSDVPNLVPLDLDDNKKDASDGDSDDKDGLAKLLETHGELH